MDRHAANSLIADSGLHFKTVQVDINPDEPLVLPNGKTLKYTFLEAIDFLNDARIRVDLCSAKDNQWVPVTALRQAEALETAPNSTLVLDESGVPTVKPDAIVSLMESYPSGSPELMSVNSLAAYRVKQGTEVKTAFELLEGNWLPMPMYELEGAQSSSYPNGWCRVRFDAVGERQKNGQQRYRFTWAFDTRLAADAAEGVLRPAFLEGSGEKKLYALCNRADLLLGNFLTLPNGQNEAPIGDYLVSLLGLDLSKEGADPHKYKFIGWYVYFINYLRLCGAAPEVTLYHKTNRQIPVDMSVDIGNSRTCAVLFENGDFTKARMLRLRDMSEPWQTYENAIDMRIVFRRADFGGDLTLDKGLFQWQSLVRVGDEAKRLMYHSLEAKGESEKMNGYSSPKRYLWDDRPFDSRWELMVTKDDPTNLQVNPHIFIEGFTDHFDDDGTYLEQAKELDLFTLGQTEGQCRYSRRSLMSFVMIEMLQQALCYINSSKFRDMHGQIDCRRYLRNIIITCPTAMPLAEQQALRKAAWVATDLLHKLTPGLPEMTITPDPEKLAIASSDQQELEKRGWLYDEAFASQLVYLYAELAERYSGQIDRFFKLKGHKREDIAALGFEGNALTVGTIDIGAGTTDIMVTAYGQLLLRRRRHPAQHHPRRHPRRRGPRERGSRLDRQRPVPAHPAYDPGRAAADSARGADQALSGRRRGHPRRDDRGGIPSSPPPPDAGADAPLLLRELRQQERTGSPQPPRFLLADQPPDVAVLPRTAQAGPPDPRLHLRRDLPEGEAGRLPARPFRRALRLPLRVPVLAL